MLQLRNLHYFLLPLTLHNLILFSEFSLEVQILGNTLEIISVVVKFLLYNANIR